MDPKEAFPSHNQGPIARRRQGSLDRSEEATKKRRPFGETKATASFQPVVNSVKSGDTFRSELNPPRRHTKMGYQVSEGLKSVPKMNELHPKLRESLGFGRDRHSKLDSQPRQAPRSRLLSPESLERNAIGTTMRERILQNAQESLLKMIDEGDSELVIANQVDVVEKLRARINPRTTLGPVTEARTRDDNRDRKKRPLQKTRDRRGSSTGSFFFSADDTTDVVTIESSLESQLESDSDSGANSPAKKKARYGSMAKKRARKGAQNKDEAAALQTAFPADRPTSLPHRYRTTKALSPTAIAKQSKIHVTFDPTKTNQFDRHIRKINTTNAAAEARRIVARNLHDSIGQGGLTDSDEDTSQARINGSNRGDEMEDDLQTLPNASRKDAFEDFDLMDEEADLLSDDDSIFHGASPSERRKNLE